MTEYIDREDLAKHLDILYNRLCGKSPYFYCGFMTAVDYVKEFSAADVAPVVRCKNCKHSWEDIGGLCCSHGTCVDLTVPGDFYCAYGERKNGDGGDAAYGDKIMEYAPEANGRRGKKMGLEE